MRSIVFVLLSIAVLSVGRVNAENTNEAVRPAGIQPVTPIKAAKATASQPLTTSTKRAKSKLSSKTVIGLIDQLNRLNGQIFGIEEEQGIDELLEKKNQLISELINGLSTTEIRRLPAITNKRQLNLLVSRIAINGERGNPLAVHRDQAKLAYYKTVTGYAGVSGLLKSGIAELPNRGRYRPNTRLNCLTVFGGKPRSYRYRMIRKKAGYPPS